MGPVGAMGNFENLVEPVTVTLLQYILLLQDTLFDDLGPGGYCNLKHNTLTQFVGNDKRTNGI